MMPGYGHAQFYQPHHDAWRRLCADYVFWLDKSLSGYAAALHPLLFARFLREIRPCFRTLYGCCRDYAVARLCVGFCRRNVQIYVGGICRTVAALLVGISHRADFQPSGGISVLHLFDVGFECDGSVEGECLLIRCADAESQRSGSCGTGGDGCVVLFQCCKYDRRGDSCQSYEGSVGE